MNRGLVLLVVFFLASAVHADEWQRIVCIDSADLTVSLLVKPVASAADEDFIGWELTNRTQQPLAVDNVHFQLDPVTISDRHSGERLKVVTLISGNPYDLLWRERGPAPERRIDLIPPGVSRYLRYCSVRSLAASALPSEGVWQIEGRARIELWLKENRDLHSPVDGVPFQFDLPAPDEAALVKMSQRLKRLFAAPVESFGDAAALKTLLSVERVASSVSIHDLLNGLRRKDHAASDPIVAYIDRKYPADPATIYFWIDALNRSDYLLLNKLSAAKNVRSPALIDPLVKCVERGGDNAPYFALRMLHNQRSVMPDRLAVARRVSPVVLSRCAFLQKGEMPPIDKAYLWMSRMEEVSLTADPDLAKYFLPYLDRKEVVISAREISIMNSGVDTRFCDLAYNCLLTLLDRPGKPFTMLDEPRTEPDQEFARRDALIAAMKAELR